MPKPTKAQIDKEALDREWQEQTIRSVMEEPELKDLVAAGYTITRVDLPNGDVQIQLTR